MNNIKPYCQFVHRLMSPKALLSIPSVSPPVEKNAIILLAFPDDRTALADIFTLTEVIEEKTLTRLVAVNRKGDRVCGTWVEGRYAWQYHVQDLHSWIVQRLSQCYGTSFRHHRRCIRQVVQCVKDQIPLCDDLLPTGCKFVQATVWTNPPNRTLPIASVVVQSAVIPILFIADSPYYFLVSSLAMMGLFHVAQQRVSKRYIKKHGKNAPWEEWGEYLDNLETHLPDDWKTGLTEKTRELFEYAIQRTSPRYDVLMRTRYRIVQKLLDDLVQHDTPIPLQLKHYRLTVVKFIVL